MLRRLWKVKIVEKYGTKKRKPKIREETIIAWNAVDANRKAGGRLAEEPEPVGWVTWPRGEEKHVYFIDNPTDGPLEDEKVEPSVGTVSDEEDWDF